MIQAFIDSWELSRNAYLTGWLCALLLSLVGVIVVARNQIFIGAAVSQASTLGMAAVMWLGLTLGPEAPPWLVSDEAISAAAVLLSILAAWFTEGGGGSRRESHEALLGWVFLTGSAGSILLVSHSPHGLEEIHRVIGSSIIGASDGDVQLFALLFLLAALGIAACRRSLLLYAIDPGTAEALGVPLRVFKMAVAVALGLSAGLAIRVTGLLYTFGMLVLPPLIAKNLCREIRSMFVVAPAIGLVASIAAFVVANQEDYPPGQMAVAFLSGLLVLAWGFRRLRS